MSRNPTAVIIEDHQSLMFNTSGTEIPGETLLVSKYFRILVWGKSHAIDQLSQNPTHCYSNQCVPGNEGARLHLFWKRSRILQFIPG